MKLSTWIKLWKTYSFREFIFLFSSAILKPRRNLLLHNHVLTRLIDSLSLVDINKDECVVKYKDYELILRPQSSDFFVYNQVILNEEYAPLIEKIIKRKQQETITTIIDLGANIGLSSLYFHFHFPKAIVYALEPVPDNFSLLKKNSLGKDKIVAFHKAIWDSSVDLAMDYSFRDGQAWSITLKPVKYKKEKTIAGITLFQFLEENCIDTIDLLKIDIEGAERFLFEDHKTVLNLLKRTRYIAMEIHEEFISKDSVISALLENGFEFMIQNETLFAVKKQC